MTPKLDRRLKKKATDQDIHVQMQKFSTNASKLTPATYKKIITMSNQNLSQECNSASTYEYQSM